MIFKKIKRHYHQFIQILSSHSPITITSIFAIFMLLCFGISCTLALHEASSSSGKKLPIYCVDSPEKKIAITFDAAWGNEDTAKILEILEKHNVKATFFMTGGWVESYPTDVKAIYEAGHELGNHSENHKQMSTLSGEECQQEIKSVHDKVKEITGYDMKVFRPPYGDYNNTLIDSAKALGYYSIQWNVDSLDWKDYGADSIISTICNNKNLGNGSIILCHNGAKYITDALDTVLTNLTDSGYEFVTISELIYTGEEGVDYKMDNEGRQIKLSANNKSEPEDKDKEP